MDLLAVGDAERVPAAEWDNSYELVARRNASQIAPLASGQLKRFR
jgi:hypothetical protein